MNFKQLIQDYFTFSRNERRGIILLLILIFLLSVANKVIFYFETPAKIDATMLDSYSQKLGTLSDSINQQANRKKLFAFNPNTIESGALDSLDLPESVKQNLLKLRNKGGKFYSSEDFRKIYGLTDASFRKISPYLLFKSETKSAVQVSSNHELFMFDPNKATNSDFLRLGFSEKQIATIRKYMDKIGIFRNKEDFLKIRVISEDQKRILSDYIIFGGSENSVVQKQIDILKPVMDLNTADSIMIKQLPGIGAILSKRIVKYRDLLGGFYSVKQLKEVYGLSEETIQKIENKVTFDTTKIRKIDVNFADINELSKHPYLQKHRAMQIVKFRTKNGFIREYSILLDSMILNIDDYDKIKPYL